MHHRRMVPAARRAVARAALLAGALALTAAPAPAQSKRGTPPPARIRTGLEAVEKQVKEFTLANGLRFMVVERRQSPVFSFMTVVDAGAVDEEVGTTGLAHMMEHMAFKGTSIVGTRDFAAERPLLEKEEQAFAALLAERRKRLRADTTALARLEAEFKRVQEEARAPVVSNGFTAVLEQNGATGLNASTAEDYTNYYYSLPSNRLELWALMEGGRMTTPVFREFYKERDVVYEERRMRYESSPIGRLFWEFITTAFIAHPYGFGGIGYPSDLKTFTRTEGEAFYERYYVAKNMAVAVVGDVAVDDVKRVAQTYWSGLSDAPKPPPVDTEEPQQMAERRILLEDPAQPFIGMGWHIPAGTDPSYPAYEAAASLMAGGDFARLNKLLVKDKKICTQVTMFTGLPGEKYPTLLTLFAIPATGQDPLAVEAAIHEAMDEVMTARPFTAEELEGYKVRVRARKIAQVESNAGLADALAKAQIARGDWREFFRDAERVQALTVTDVMEALKASVTRSNRTVAMIVPPKTASAEGGR
jgi:predicted Zn-dependent peptidase